MAQLFQSASQPTHLLGPLNWCHSFFFVCGKSNLDFLCIQDNWVTQYGNRMACPLLEANCWIVHREFISRLSGWPADKSETAVQFLCYARYQNEQWRHSMISQVARPTRACARFVSRAPKFPLSPILSNACHAGYLISCGLIVPVMFKSVPC